MKAQKMKMPVEMKIIYVGNRVVITAQELTKKTATPMVLERIVIDTSKESKKALIDLYLDCSGTKSSIDCVNPQPEKPEGLKFIYK